MSQILNFNISMLVYSDTAVSNNPRLRVLDYTRQQTGVNTSRTRTVTFSVPAGETQEVIDLRRVLSTDSTTEWTVSVPEVGTMRLTHSGGTAPNLNTVRVGDKVDIPDDFDPDNSGTHSITEVGSDWFEVASVLVTPETVKPETSVVIYPASYKWLYLESDQSLAVRLNSDVGDACLVDPVNAGQPDDVGVFVKHGKVYALTVVNKSQNAANIVVLLSE